MKEMMLIYHGHWACMLDENNNQTGIYVQIPENAHTVNLS